MTTVIASVSDLSAVAQEAKAGSQTHLCVLATACARVLQINSPQKTEGAGDPQERDAGKTGCALHPRSHVQMHIAKNAHEHTGSAEAVRPSLRNGFTAYFVLSPARPGLFATVIRVMRNIIANLTPATGASGPHDFAVRFSHARQSQPPRPPLPAPNVRDDRETPLLVSTGWQGISR
jgi:hypothetical protein